ncbi:MAG: hypothetical protein ACLFO1_05615 [Spirochaetaceae bacterium]
MKLFLRFRTIAPIAIFFVAVPIFGQVVNDMDLHLHVSLLQEPQPPEIVDGQLLLTYRTDEYNRYVAAAFAHEDYRRIHEYQRVDRPGTDMFFLLVPLPEDTRELRYRIVVDGLWQVDPFNPRTARDSRGRSVSVFEVPPQPAERASSPIIMEDRRVEFVFDTEVLERRRLETIDGKLLDIRDRESPPVYVAGSFNNFDPFMYRLRPRSGSSSELSFTTHLPRGTHYYYFVVDGLRVLDPLNAERSVRRGSHTVNRVTVP